MHTLIEIERLPEDLVSGAGSRVARLPGTRPSFRQPKMFLISSNFFIFLSLTLPAERIAFEAYKPRNLFVRTRFLLPCFGRKSPDTSPSFPIDGEAVENALRRRHKSKLRGSSSSRSSLDWGSLVSVVRTPGLLIPRRVGWIAACNYG